MTADRSPGEQMLDEAYQDRYGQPRPVEEGGAEPPPSTATVSDAPKVAWNRWAYGTFDEAQVGGAFDGHEVTSDADGL